MELSILVVLALLAFYMLPHLRPAGSTLLRRQDYLLWMGWGITFAVFHQSGDPLLKTAALALCTGVLGMFLLRALGENRLAKATCLRLLPTGDVPQWIRPDHCPPGPVTATLPGRDFPGLPGRTLAQVECYRGEKLLSTLEVVALSPEFDQSPDRAQLLPYAMPRQGGHCVLLLGGRIYPMGGVLGRELALRLETIAC